MSHQRRRGSGIEVKVWKATRVTDRRGNSVITAQLDELPYTVMASYMPMRSAEAELPGQQQIKVARLTVSADLEDVNLWSRVEVFGEMWDVISPPLYHHGVRRHTRHLSIEIKQRGF